jgi:hypothetical protein
MRAKYAAVALVAVMAGASAIRAGAIDSDSSAIHLKAAPGATARAKQMLVQAAPQNGPSPLSKTPKPRTKFNWQATSGNPSVAPFKWAGLLQIPTLKDPNIFTQCTAQFITDTVILTAAHCLQDPGTPKGPWPNPSSGTFMLQYQNGDASKTFKIVCGAANPLWAKELTSWSGVEHDFAMVLVDGTSPTGHISYALDWRGKYDYAFRIGYPQDILSGSFIEFAPGIVFPGNSIPFAETTKAGGPPQLSNAVVQWGPITDATHGMSGGAWIANLDEGEGFGKNVLIAVTSSGPQEPNSEIPIFPGGTWAAYLTAAEFNPLLNFVSNGCK